MIDLYLRADTSEALASACPFLRADTSEAIASACPFLRGPDDIWITGTTDYALSIIGPVVTAYDDEGEPVVDARFHANLRCTEVIAALVPPEVIVNPDPNNPVRVWL